MELVGITGVAQSGKNTTGAFLGSALVERGHTVAMDSFAGTLKREARELTGWDGVKTDWWREWMQRRGAWARSLNPCYWLTALGIRWAGLNHRTDPEFLIIPDVRYANEMEFVRAAGVLWLCIGRGGLDGDAARHESERDVVEIAPQVADEVIDNGKLSMPELLAYVKHLVSKGAHRKLQEIGTVHTDETYVSKNGDSPPHAARPRQVQGQSPFSAEAP